MRIDLDKAWIGNHFLDSQSTFFVIHWQIVTSPILYYLAISRFGFPATAKATFVV